MNTKSARLHRLKRAGTGALALCLATALSGCIIDPVGGRDPYGPFAPAPGYVFSGTYASPGYAYSGYPAPVYGSGVVSTHVTVYDHYSSPGGVYYRPGYRPYPYRPGTYSVRQPRYDHDARRDRDGDWHREQDRDHDRHDRRGGTHDRRQSLGIQPFAGPFAAATADRDRQPARAPDRRPAPTTRPARRTSSNPLLQAAEQVRQQDRDRRR